MKHTSEDIIKFIESNFNRKRSIKKLLICLLQIAYLKSKPKCSNPKCNNVITKIIGTGKYCCRKCSNTKIHSKETKDKISKGVIKHFKEHPENISHKTPYLTDYQKQIKSEKLKNALSSYYKNSPEAKEKISKAHKGKHFSEEHKYKLHVAVQKRIREGTFTGWSTRRTKESFPEHYWHGVLDNLKLNYKQENGIRKDLLGLNKKTKYFLDFFLYDKMIDLEIDGGQHNDINVKKLDAERDNLLKAIGIIVYRIPWINPTGIHKKEVEKQIKDFIAFYNSKPFVEEQVFNEWLDTTSCIKK